MKCLITQSNYIPWKGYFDSISQVDTFVVYDDMQYTKRDWRNRNQIKTDTGLKWLSIPVEVSGKYLQKIKDTKVADKKWNIAHWDQIKEWYKNAPYYKEMAEWIEPLYRNCQFDYLTEINLHFINAICSFLKINTQIKFSSEFTLHNERTQRLVNICTDLNATEYYSGPAARAYMDEKLFEEMGISVKYFEYNGYPEYPQQFPPFSHNVSILDLILNNGSDSSKFLRL